MAIYRFSAQIVKRSDGRSATAAAAYRAGAEIPDARTGLVFDYTRRRGVAHAEIIAPPGTPAPMLDRVALWNAVEAAESRRDAQLAREIELALPYELTDAARLNLVRDFVTREFVARGMIADFAMHRPDRRGDGRNHHAHVMLSLRPITETGFGPKARAWNDTAELEHWREAWADAVNQALARQGYETRVDHRSYAARGLALEPEPKMGPTATAMERRGRRSHAGDDRRAVKARNHQRTEALNELALIRIELEALDQPEVESQVAAVAGGSSTTTRPAIALPELDPVPPPEPRDARRHHAAGWTGYLYAMWTTVARAVTTPFQALAASVSRRRGPKLHH
jgi:ATP-dependent exoDNAse (exonuclease V) alpha subunit